MFTVISRIIQYGLKNFRRNGWLSAVTVEIMILALLVSIGLMLSGVVIDRAVSSVQDIVDISVYFKTNTPEDEILNIKNSLESLSEVKEVEYVSSAQTLEINKAKHANDSIGQAISELNANPYEPSLNITARQLSQYAEIAKYFEAPGIKEFVDTVSYTKNKGMIERLNTMIQVVNRGGIALTILLALIAAQVVFNTIRLAIYSNRDEISVMRVVGASNSLVRGPYMVEGIVCGILAAFLSVLAALPIVYFVSPYLDAFIPNLNISGYFLQNIFKLLLYQILFGAAIGGLSSFVAVRRYLKN
ncbi:MAG: ABC transporter permease [Candidatus Liptonbacteria bacterium]|nr:ABC transporter permease [Candidatus Liptonbacteria bacterium]